MKNAFYHNTPYTGDFANYYCASKEYLLGRDLSSLYDPVSFNRTDPDAELNRIKSSHFLNYTPVPPFSILFYLPFALLPIKFSFLLWNVTGIAAFLLSLIRLMRFKSIDLQWLPAILLAFAIPVKSNLQNGQSYLLIFSLIAEGYIAWRREKRWFATLLWAIAFHLKIFPGILLLYLIVRKDWRGTSFYVLSSILISVLTVAFLGWELSRSYFSEILPRLNAGEINDPYALSFQSMQVLLKKIFVPDLLLNPEAAADSPFTYIILLSLFKGMITALAVLSTRSRFTAFTSLIFCSLLISGYGTTYSLVLLVFPLLSFMEDRPLASRISLLLLFGICVSIPVYLLATLPLSSQFIRLYILLLIFLLHSYFFFEWKNVKLALIVSSVFIVSSFTAIKKPSESSYFFKEEKALLIMDFQISDSLLIYAYKGMDGYHEKTIPLGFTAHKVEQSGQTKSVPFRTWNHMIVNDSLEIFLSDENRGVGFYTLRKKLSDDR